MTNKEAIKYLIIPSATSTEPGEEYLKQKEAYEMAINALERPQDEYTEEDMEQAIKENFGIGYEMAKNKYKRPEGEWVVTAEDNDGVHRICCPFCSYEKGSNNTDPIIVTFTNFPKFCENCGADMSGGTK